MEEHAPLKGLWDALNTRAFKKIADKKYDCLLGSEKFKQLRSVAKQVQPRTWNANYTSPGDDDITIDPYIKKLEALIPAANQQKLHRQIIKVDMEFALHIHFFACHVI